MSTVAIDFDLDHFRAYNVGSPLEPFVVGLRGPFDDGFQETTVQSLDHFANPANKNREGWMDPTHHQTWYRLEEREEPRREMNVCNQFGDQTFTVGAAALLLVPALKLERGMGEEPLPEYNHFLAYRVDSAAGFRPQQVALSDQFLRNDSPQVRAPRFFAVPVAKDYAGQVTEPVDENATLTIYELGPRRMELVRYALDQFGEHQMDVVSTALMAVPTAVVPDETGG